MPKVPIPNQPAFVFNYNLLTINMSGSVVNKKSKVATLYVHGNVIRGTQTILGIPVVWTGFSHKGRIFVHGYFLTPYTPFASTRFRIPLIVSIWKLYLGCCNVIANMTETAQNTTVYASTEIETESLKPTWVQLSTGMESLDSMTGHFSISNIAHNRHTMAAAIAPVSRPVKFAVSLTGIWKSLRYKLFTRPLPMEQAKIAHAHADLLPTVQEKQARIKAHVAVRTITGTWKLSLSLVSSLITGIHKVSASIARSLITGLHKVSAKTATSALKQKHRMGVKLRQPNALRITKLSIHLIRPVAQCLTKVQVHVVEPVIQSLHRLKVHIQPKFLEGLLGRIQWLLAGRNISQSGLTKFTTTKLTQKSTIQVTGRGYEGGKFRVGIQLLAQRVARLLHIHTSDRAQQNGRLVIHNSQIKGDSKQYLMLSAESVERTMGLHLNYTTIEEWIDLNIDVIPGLAERYVLMKPVEVPQVRWLNLLVTVLNTETLSFIRFAIDELVQDPTVRISMFDHEVVSLLQWYIHGGLVNNDGYSNEVIFDLGEADDGSGGGGTIPPIPSRQWSGGYVEDPFKAVGYEPTTNSTGYVSPKVTNWVSGSKMYWSKSTEPFQEA